MLMGTGARRLGALTVAAGTTFALLLSGANTASASGAGVVTSGSVITVTVSGTGYTPGKSGSRYAAGAGGGVSVTVPATCWTFAMYTGKSYYDYVHSGKMAYQMRKMGDLVIPPPRAGYELHKDDDKGQWWGAMCDPSNWPNQQDTAGYTQFRDQFDASHPPVFVEAGQAPPAGATPQISPELLRDVAIENLTLPAPKLDWNPKRQGNQGTLVNLETWFWLNDAPTTLRVTAAAGGTEATVNVTFDGMDITAPGEARVSCAGAGTPYTAGAHNPTCALAFTRASSALGLQGTPVTVNTKWTGTWTANGADRGLINPQPAPKSANQNVVVDEVQTLVTGAR